MKNKKGDVFLGHSVIIIIIIIIQYLYSAIKSCKGYRGAVYIHINIKYELVI